MISDSTREKCFDEDFLRPQIRIDDETPSCPMNITSAKASFVHVDNIGVIPAERPVVPKADVTSNSNSVKSKERSRATA